MSQTGIDQVTYGVKDLETAKRFWTDFGLKPVENDARHAVFAAQNGATIVVRAADDPGLPPPVGKDVDATVREATFGVKTKEDLAKLAANLAADRDVKEDADGTIHAVDPLGFGVAFRVTRTKKVTAPEQEINVPGRVSRLNRRGPLIGQAHPYEISHIVYMTDQLETHKEFYVDRLGFKITDAYPGRGYFARGGAAHNHHNLFLLDPGIGKRGFHHLAFEVGTIHELFGGGNNMTRHGWDTMLGPGRHPISSCYFWYFKNPCGGAAEYDFDSDVVDDDWEPTDFESTPQNFAEWCLAEGMGEALLYKGIQRG
jgi:catechol 2,3-dioxygenase-like lactoylglutathione lyase family enzyme